MPGKIIRRKTGYRKTRKSVAWYNKKYSVSQIARQAWKGVKIIKGMINCEKHYHDSYSAINPDNAGVVIHLTNIAQGDTNATRTGMSILLRSIYVQWEAVMDTGNVNTGIRFIVFKDTGSSGSAPSASDVLEYTSSGYSIMSPLKKFNGKRFKVICDNRFNLSNAGKNSMFYKRFLKVYDHVRYDGTTANDYSTNNYFALFITDTDNGSTRNDPNIDYMIRMGFYDN